MSTVIFHTSQFLTAVQVEVARAREKHAPINSVHEGYAVLLEEVEEFWAEVMKKRSERDPKRMAEELVQIAAMAMRTAEDVLAFGKENEKS